MHTAATLECRDFVRSDLPALAQAMGDARVTQFYGLENPLANPHTLAREQLDWYHAQAQSGAGWWQALCIDGAVAGAIGLYDRDDDGDSAELGYWLLPSHWGHGVMRAAMRQWLPGAFQRLALHSVVAYVEPANSASIQLLSRAGFTQEGLLRECTRRGTDYVSLLRFSLLVSELSASSSPSACGSRANGH